MKILYLQIRSTLFLVFFLTIFSHNGFGQSDTCTAPPVLTVGTTCSTTPYNIANAFTNNPAIPLTAPCSATPTRDGWFIFTTNATTTNITITAAGNVTGHRIGLAIYTGSCGSLVLVTGGCVIPAAASGSLSNVTVLPNTTYYLRLMRIFGSAATDDMTGTICVVANPTFNDNCNLAVTLAASSNSVCTNTSATTVGATQSQPGCAGVADDDVWFRLVATSTSHNITVKGNTLYDPVLEMFTGTCGALTSIGCVDGTIAAPEVAIATGLTIGATYYIRVYSYGSGVNQGTFDICITTPDNPAPYCVAEGTDPTRYINNFSTTGALTNINNPTGYSAAGYGNYTAQSVVSMASSTINFNTAFTGGTFGFNIWVDWNNNNSFDAAERVFNSGPTYVAFVNSSFIVPAGQTSGNYRMRIRAHWLSTDPASCGSNTYGEVEDYTLTVQPLLCSSVPGSLTATAITTTTANFNWAATAPIPASGYTYYYSTSNTPPPFLSTGSGNVPNTSTTVPLSALTPNTTYYAWVRSNCGGANGMGAWAGPISFTTLLSTTNVTVCQGASGNLTAAGTCNGFTSSMSISGSWNINPQAPRIATSMVNSATCNFSANTSTYSTYTFQVSAAGTYIFTMAPNANYDGMAYIVTGAFTPGSCGSGTWIVGDDDSGTGLEPRLTANLNPGIAYTLVSTVFSFTNITITDNFQYAITGPGSILTGTPGVMQWYTAASGGTPIGTGNSFNPVGVAGSGLANTNTPGTTIFYAACSSTPGVRSPASFIINARPTSVISASGSICNNDAALNITLTGTSPWSITYQNNIGDPAVTLTNILTNTLNIPVSPSSAAIYTITSMNDASCPSVSNTGSASFSANTWLGNSTVWSAPANWSAGTVPSSSDCVIIPTTISIATIAGSELGYASQLLVKNGGRLDVTNQRTLTVTNQVIVEPLGTLNIENSSSLLQINNTVNTGSINMTRITKPMYRYDYTYWNSPVTLASDFTLSELSPLTLSDKYYRWQPTISNGAGNWIQLPALTTNMNPINGYIVRAPQTFSTDPMVKSTFTAIFRGTPNNGDIVMPISTGTLGVGIQTDKWNLIGNPYPSAIDAFQFLTVNNAVVDGTMYIWTHNSALSTSNPDPFYGNFVSNYSGADYALLNTLGGTAATSGGSAPTQYLPAGASFFIQGRVPSGNATFTNAMRVVNNNNDFFKIDTSSKLVSVSPEAPVEKYRIWLNFMNATNVFSQILIGYTEGATLGYDNGLDGNRLASSSTGFYSVIEGNNLAIQGRPLPFNDADTVPLGYVTNLNEEFSIRIQATDPFFDGYEIYLEDKDAGILHNLKTAPYFFTSGVGRFDNRFEIQYVANLLAVQDGTVATATTGLIKDNILQIKSSKNVESVTIFDISGKKVITLNSSNSSGANIWRFPYAEGIYLAVVTAEDQSTVTLKLKN